jgi:hypothetical protein
VVNYFKEVYRICIKLNWEYDTLISFIRKHRTVPRHISIKKLRKLEKEYDNGNGCLRSESR